MYKIIFFTIIFFSFALASCKKDSDRDGIPDSKDKCSKEYAKTKSGCPEPKAPDIQVVKPKINVYVENSGSMWGYVKGVTEFEQTVYNYLSDIKIAQVSDSINLNYINSESIRYASGADADVIEDFIDKLDPSTFKQKGGKMGTSDIADVLKIILRETGKDEIGILITDGIFSPGKSKDAAEYLVNQEIGIKNSFSEYLQKFPNSAVIVYQMISNFSGVYYNNIDSKSTINEERPYYIWLIGDATHLASLREKVPEKRFNGRGVANTFSIVKGNQSVDYAVKANSGNFQISHKNPKTNIENLENDSRNNKVKFAINTNFKKLLLNDAYLLNTKNYELNHYMLSVSPATNDKYTHTLTFTSDKVKNGELKIKLKTQLPEWIEKTNDSVGVQAVKGKTYGIKYQLKGVFEAFTFNSTYYTEININIK